jgi:hypothetical protein
MTVVLLLMTFIIITMVAFLLMTIIIIYSVLVCDYDCSSIDIAEHLLYLCDYWWLVLFIIHIGIIDDDIVIINITCYYWYCSFIIGLIFHEGTLLLMIWYYYCCCGIWLLMIRYWYSTVVYWWYWRLSWYLARIYIMRLFVVFVLLFVLFVLCGWLLFCGDDVLLLTVLFGTWNYIIIIIDIRGINGDVPLFILLELLFICYWYIIDTTLMCDIFVYFIHSDLFYDIDIDDTIIEVLIRYSFVLLPVAVFMVFLIFVFGIDSIWWWLTIDVQCVVAWYILLIHNVCGIVQSIISYSVIPIHGNTIINVIICVAMNVVFLHISMIFNGDVIWPIR